MIDTHSHLFLCKRPVTEILAAATAAGISHMICVATNLENSKICLSLSQTYSNISATVGLYPSEYEHFSDLSEIRTLAESGLFSAIGEIGLDYYHNYGTPDAQRKLFVAQLELASELNLPVIIHNRHSEADMKAIVSEFKHVKKVFHCYGSKPEFTEAVMDQNTYFSFTATVMYSEKNPSIFAAKTLPLDKIMLETDCPYLTPSPFKGQENHPALLSATADYIAKARGISTEAFVSATTQTALDFFSLL